VGIAGVGGWIVLAQLAHARTALIELLVAVVAAGAMRRYAPADGRAPFVVVAVTLLSTFAGLLGSEYALLADVTHKGFFTVIGDVAVEKVPRLVFTGTDAVTWLIVALSIGSGYLYARKLRPS